jgi:hypothetical protein
MTLRQQLHHASLLASANAARIDHATSHLAHELAILDGYATTASGADRGARGERTIRVDIYDHNDNVVASDLVPVTAVEDVALKRQDLSDQLDDLHLYVRGILTMHHELIDRINRAIGTRTATPPPPECDGRGLEGFDVWGEPCDRGADKAGLCARHYQRCYRWRRDHGLRPLNGDNEAA